MTMLTYKMICSHIKRFAYIYKNLREISAANIHNKLLQQILMANSHTNNHGEF